MPHSTFYWGDVRLVFFFRAENGLPTDRTVYSNSMLATLNARKILRGGVDNANTMSGQNVTLKNEVTSSAATLVSFSIELTHADCCLFSLQHHPNISIKVDTTQEYSRDESVRIIFLKLLL